MPKSQSTQNGTTIKIFNKKLLILSLTFKNKLAKYTDYSKENENLQVSLEKYIEYLMSTL